MGDAFVTDTHPLLHYFFDGGRKLSRKAKQVFVDAIDHRIKIIYVPAPVIWEISMLVEDKDIELSGSFATWVKDLFLNNSMLLPQAFDNDTVIHGHGLKFHNDPFDRAIVASALQLDLPLITNDSVMHNKKPCAIYWD